MKALKEKSKSSKNNHLFSQKGTASFFKQTPFFGPNTIQAKLTIGQPGDKYEREADSMADQVVNQLSNPSPIHDTTKTPFIQRQCTACNEKEEKGNSIMRKSNTGGGIATPTLSSQLNNSKGGGRHLSNNTNREMSSAFRTDFSRVRIHTGSKAIQMNRGLNARAFTHGSDIYFNRGEYNSKSSGGKRLLAHELTHVVQQTGGQSVQRNSKGTPNIQMLQIQNSCSAQNQLIRGGETEGLRMTRSTIATLQHIESMIRTQEGPLRVMPTPTRILMNTFGDVGGLGGGGGMSFIGSLIRRFQRIEAGFGTRKTRCDVNTIPNNECTWRSAFVVSGNRDDIFLCPNFFATPNSAREGAIERGRTLIHELAHSVLNATHAGIAEGVFPATAFDCNSPFGLTYDQAKRNAFAYGMLANCLHGNRPIGAMVTASAPPTAATNQSSGNHGWLGAGLGALGGGLIGGLIGGLATGGLVGGLIGAGIGLATGGLIGGLVGSQFKREER